MSAGDFFDTNVLIYAAIQDAALARVAELAIKSGGVISVQVLNEFASVMTVKHGKGWAEVETFLTSARRLLEVRPLTEQAHDHARDLVERYKLQWWDALIAASALEAGCHRLLTQDMHAGLIVDGRLTVVNPFA